MIEMIFHKGSDLAWRNFLGGVTRTHIQPFADCSTLVR